MEVLSPCSLRPQVEKRGYEEERCLQVAGRHTGDRHKIMSHRDVRCCDVQEGGGGLQASLTEAEVPVKEGVGMKELRWRADGDANKYTILSGEGERPDWVASILLNGEFHTKDQEELMDKIVSVLNCTTENVPHGTSEEKKFSLVMQEVKVPYFCPNCEEHVEAYLSSISECGVPYCSDCDNDMEPVGDHAFVPASAVEEVSGE
jgi:hypothetical protein